MKLERDGLARQVKELGGDVQASTKGDTGTQSLQFYNGYLEPKPPPGYGGAGSGLFSF